MERADVLKVPELQDLTVCKNKENCLDIPDGEDQPGKTRQVVRIARCPFTPCFHPETGIECQNCSKQSWAGANVWSLQSPYHVLGYLLQHATKSRWHNLSKEEAFDMIIANWSELEWEYYQDTYENRQQYRAQLKGIEMSKVDKGKGKGKKRKHDGVGDGQHVTREEVGEIVMQTLAAASGAAASEAASSSGAWNRSQPTPRHPPTAPKALADLAGGACTLSLAPKTVTIPLEKLKVMQDSLQRAEHAISSSLAFTVEQSNKLAHERLIVLNAIDVISGISGVQSAHFGHLG